MALIVRKQSEEMLYALVAANNATRRAAGVLGSLFHADVTSDRAVGDFRSPASAAATVTAANATNLDTSVTLVNQIRVRWLQHRDDALAHKVADSARTLTAPIATEIESAKTLANELKADYNAHCASTSHHYTADATNTVAASDATDQTSLNTLLNEMKADFNAHIASAPAGHSIQLIEA